MNSINPVTGQDSQRRRLRRPTARNSPSTMAMQKPARVMPMVLSEASSKRGRMAQANSQSKKFMTRSEEHTSELQSRENLVCRLLLEKKKFNTIKLTCTNQPP